MERVVEKLVEFDYSPRDAFRPYHQSKKRFCCTVAHRRAGKTVARINKLIRYAADCKLPNPRFAYIAPYYVQAKDIAWQYLKHYTAPFDGLLDGRKINESELSVTLPHNNAVIRLYGAENAERLRGVYADGIVLDETQGMVGATLRTVILPCLSDRSGWLDVSGTPKGWENLLGEIVKMAQANPDEWFLQILKASETGILPQSELDMLRKAMMPNQYAQELECSFDAAIEGAVYGEWMSAAQEEGRVREAIYDATLPVHTAWDLGYDDATAVVFYQLARNEVRIIDYYENNQQDIYHYCDVLIGKAYKYGEHYVPHDAANKLLAAGGRSIVQQAFEKGVKMRVVPATTQQNSINATRSIIPRCWFDATKTAQLISALKQYQFEYDERNRVFRSTPKHDWSSHGCFVGSTKVLTRYGTYQIMNLPQTGEVLTPCGWKQYHSPRITRRNARLVEVMFKDGNTVKCTPDHLFMTDKGWKSAECLTKTSMIQSTLTNLPNISMGDYTRYGQTNHIYQRAAHGFIGLCGKWPLEQFLRGATFTIKMEIQKTIDWIISNVLMRASIPLLHGKKHHINDLLDFQQKRARKPLNGTLQKKGVFGTAATQNVRNHGQNGVVKHSYVLAVINRLMLWLEKAVTHKSIAQVPVEYLHIDSVRKIEELSDVWCLTVPDAGCFSLSNGAVVHNCDAFELIGRMNLDMVKNTAKPEPKFLQNMNANDLFWPENDSNPVNRRI